MRLRNFLIVVSNIEKSKNFYHDLFEMQVVRDFGDNVILSGGLVLQERSAFETVTGEETVVGNASELYFELKSLDLFLKKMKKYYEDVEIVNLRRNSWGKKTAMIKDPDGHLIEVSET